MKLQRQHFLLSYFKILSVDRAGVRTRDLPRDSPTFNQLSHRCAVVAAKTRVTPVRSLSIPKLELQAAVLSLRLGNMIKKEHDFDIAALYFWSDSRAVLGHIRGPSKRHPAFIANRLSEILDTSEPNLWLHCPGKLNPADDGSRGLRADAITSESCWLNGPALLLLTEDKLNGQRMSRRQNLPFI